MSRKGLSLEEKKTRMLQLLFEKKQFFQLKELEKIAPKEKGIIANSVKDVLQALVEDGSVDTDKIGGSVHFWAFPSKIVNTKKRKRHELETQLEESSKKLKLVDEHLEKATSNKEKEGDLSDLIADIEDAEAKRNKLQAEFKRMGGDSPINVKEMKNELEPLKVAVNRWTDNIFSVKTWCKNKFSHEDKMLNKQFGIPEDLDYIE